MVQSEILNRVFRIRYGNDTGTVFTIEQDGVQFLVTAKHIFKSKEYPAADKIKILKDGGYQAFDVDIRYPYDNEVDIAVMKTTPYNTISQTFENENTSDGLVLGQDLYFLGFPYDFDQHLNKFPFCQTPVPFIKKACFSGAYFEHSKLLLDGHNNAGFSGGPVCFFDQHSNNHTMKIAAVVTGFRNNQTTVYDKDNHDTGCHINENSGIIITYDIKEAITVARNWEHET